MKGGEQHRKHGEREHPYSNRSPRRVLHQMQTIIAEVERAEPKTAALLSVTELEFEQVAN
jgi:hypothetical protein